MLKRIFSLVFISLMAIQCELPTANDEIAPIAVVIYPYDGSVISDDIKVRIEASDDDKIKRVWFYLDGIFVGETSSRPYLIDLNIQAAHKDGLFHEIQAAAEDPEGNIGYSPRIRFTIANSEDIIPPTVSIINPQGGQTVEGNIKIAALANDERLVDKVAFFIDTDSVGFDDTYPYSYDWDTTPYADSANHTIYAKAFDKGNNTATSALVTVSVFPNTDIIAPTAQITNPIAGQVVSDLVNVTIEASDNKGVSMVEFFVDGIYQDVDAEAPYQFIWDTDSYDDGLTHSMYVKVFDLAGNKSLSPITSVIVASDSTTDVAPPIVSLTYPIAGQVVFENITITADAFDQAGIEKLEFYIDGQLAFTDTDLPYGYIWDPTPIADDALHSIYIKAFDIGGNIASTEVITVFLTTNNSNDIIPPDVSMIYPLLGQVVFGTVDILIEATDEKGVDKVELYVDGLLSQTTTVEPYKFSWNTVPIADDATHTIFVKAYDETGNVSSTGLRTVFISTGTSEDILAPAVSVTYPLAGQVVFGTVDVIVEATDEKGIDKVEFFVDGLLSQTTTTEPYQFAWDTTPIANDERHTISAKAYDTSGNESSSGLRTVIVSTGTSDDIISPTVQILYPLLGAVVSGNVIVTADARDNREVTKVEFYIDGGM